MHISRQTWLTGPRWGWKWAPGWARFSHGPDRGLNGAPDGILMWFSYGLTHFNPKWGRVGCHLSTYAYMGPMVVQVFYYSLRAISDDLRHEQLHSFKHFRSCPVYGANTSIIIHNWSILLHDFANTIVPSYIMIPACLKKRLLSLYLCW